MKKIAWGFLVFALAAAPSGWVAAQQNTQIDSLILNPHLLPFQLPGLDLNFSGGGAAARGMGGAFVGLAGDLSAAVFNPAGLSTLDRPQTAVVYRYNRPGMRNRQFASGATGSGLDKDNFESVDEIDFGAIAAPGKLFGRPFVGAVAYTVFADQFYADRVNFLGPIQFDTLLQTTTFDYNRRTSGKLSGFSLAGATRVGRFSFGASFQIYQGGFTDTTDLVVGTFYVNHPPDTGYILPAEFKERLANKVSYRGSSLTLGMQAEYKSARLGLSARLPGFSLGETDLFRLRSNMDIGIFDSVFISGLPQINLSGGALFFTDSRLELPLSFSAGLSYRFGRSLLADLDYTYTNWGASELEVRRIFQAPFSNPATMQLGNAPVGLTSTHQLRLGWELGLHPGFGQMFIRGGVRTLPVRTLTNLLPIAGAFDTVFNNTYITDAQGNVIDTISTASLQYQAGVAEDRAAAGKFWHHFGASLGVGVRWNQIALDLFYDYSTYRRASQSQDPQDPLDPVQRNLTTFHRLQRHRLFVGFTGFFTRI